MNFKKKTVTGALCILMTILMIVTMISAVTVFAEDSSSLAPTGAAYVYCRNTAGWSTVYAYAWTSGAADQNAAWPGVAMENIGDNVWRCEVSADYANIIFNNGNGTQTGDLTCYTTSKIYDNSTNTWESYSSGETLPTTATSAVTTDLRAFCKNDAGWSTVYAYCWNSTTDSNAAWPGTAMTNIGDNVWRYDLSKSYANIIFNNGNGTQTADLTYPGSGYIYNNSSNSWSTYEDTEDPTSTTVKPTSSTTSTSSTTPTSSPSGDIIVFLKNSAGWSSATAYCWNSDSDNNKSWPGAAMTNIGDDVWQYVLPKSFAKIIFSNGGQSQTGDLTIPGSGYIYDNKTNKWEIYDLSPIRIMSYGTDIKSPQYKGCEIAVSTEAYSDGATLSYKFSIKNDSTSAVTVLQAFSYESTAKWTPSAVGTYTIIIDYKDSLGNTNQREISYVIEDDTNVEAPIIKKVTPGNGDYILRDSECNVDVTAGGGNTGTKLLFYKYTLEDATGNTVNVPYYTTSKTYKFTPSATGTYTLTVSVQASDVSNTTAEKEIQLECVSSYPSGEFAVKSLIADGSTVPGSTVTLSASASGGTSPYTYQFLINNKSVQNYSSKNTCTYTFTAAGSYTVKVNVADSAGSTASKTMTVNIAEESEIVKGDADGDGDITVMDATLIKRYLAGYTDVSALVAANCDTDGDGDITVVDATMINRFLAYNEW